MHTLPSFGCILRPSLQSSPSWIFRRQFLARHYLTPCHTSRILSRCAAIQSRCLQLNSKHHVYPTKVSVVTFLRSASSKQTRRPFTPNPEKAKISLLWMLIGANAAVYVAWVALFSRNTDKTIRIWLSTNLPAMFVLDSQAPRVPQFFGSLISHQNLTHLAFNMITLFNLAFFLVRTPISAAQFATLLLGSGLAGNLLWLAQTRRRGSHRRALGASGIVSGIVTSAALLYPSTRIFLVVIPMPLWVAAGLYFAVDTYNLNNEQSVVGHAAHLGGSLFGAAFYAVALRRFGGVFPLR